MADSFPEKKSELIKNNLVYMENITVRFGKVIALEEVEVIGEVPLEGHHHLHHSQTLPHLRVHVAVLPVPPLELLQGRLPAGHGSTFGVETVAQKEDLQLPGGQPLRGRHRLLALLRQHGQDQLHAGVQIRHHYGGKILVQVLN